MQGYILCISGSLPLGSCLYCNLHWSLLLRSSCYNICWVEGLEIRYPDNASVWSKKGGKEIHYAGGKDLDLLAFSKVGCPAKMPKQKRRLTIFTQFFNLLPYLVAKVVSSRLRVFISKKVTAVQFTQYLFFTKDDPGNGQGSNPIFKNTALINSTLTLLLTHPSSLSPNLLSTRLYSQLGGCFPNYTTSF